ncbi:hypothetical protein [uncultured Amnibacterium sp.]|uniref:hypothetical protein n=1 Tax=uncultured Amnibacterium sp. TaxID=1631851 RepID=UPI0035C99565
MIIIASVVVLVAAVGVGYLLLASGGGLPLSTGTSSAAPSAISSVQEGRDASNALTKLTSDPGSLVPKDQKRSVNIADAVPTGSTIQVQANSWAVASRTSGTLVATLTSPGHMAATYLVSMLKEDGRWVVLGTIPVER